MIKCLRGWQNCFVKWFIDGESEVPANRLLQLSGIQNEIPPLHIESDFWPQSQLGCAPSKMPQAARKPTAFTFLWVCIACSMRRSQKKTAYSVIELFPFNPSSVKSLASQTQDNNCYRLNKIQPKATSRESQQACQEGSS